MKIKKNYLKIVIFLLVLILVALYFYSPSREEYFVKDGEFHYSQNREKVDYKISLLSENDTFEVYKLDFNSANFLEYSTRIYALLFLPKTDKDVPAYVYLPGGGMKKEQTYQIGERLANDGIAFLTFDQRGIGETGGYYLSMEQDYNVYLQGKEPIQHLSVYDGLRAFDVVRDLDGIDHKNIAIGGESMGGRYALIAGAMDSRIKGVVVISSSGFNIKKDNSVGNDFMLSIDPDNYVGEISPRELVMIHSNNDSVIPIDQARLTFSKANEPKEFFQDDNCQHGFCSDFYDELVKGLDLVFGS